MALATTSSFAAHACLRNNFPHPFDRHTAKGRIILRSLGTEKVNLATNKRQTKSRVLSAYTETNPTSQVQERKPIKDAGNWIWTYQGKPIKIHYSKYAQTGGSTDAVNNIVLFPALSDVSTVDEWGTIAAELAESGYHVSVVDWPGFGKSGSPPLDYTAGLLEQFLTDLFSAQDSPIGQQRSIAIGAGHAATALLRATKKGLLNPKPLAICGVATTWAGPLPIVFGKSKEMEGRYALLRSSIRSPGVGWALYQFGLNSEANMKKQYITHVYSDAANVTADLVESRTELTRREGARFAPASFLTGRLDAVSSRDEFLALFEGLDVPVLMLGARNSPKRSKAEMQAVEGLEGVEHKWVKGALLPHEEFPEEVSLHLKAFLDALPA